MSFPAPAANSTAVAILGFRIISLGRSPTSQDTETKGWDSYRFGIQVAKWPSSKRMSAYTHLGRTFEEGVPQPPAMVSGLWEIGPFRSQAGMLGKPWRSMIQPPGLPVPSLWRQAGAL